MNRDEFVRRVQEIGDIESREETERAIRATFEILKRRLAGNEPDNLASQLPEELATPLRGEGGRESFALTEFYRRVGEREGAEEPKAIRHARAVASVLQEAVTTGEMDDVRAQLKEEYVELFGHRGE